MNATVDSLARLLAQAFQAGKRIPIPPELQPANRAAAYQIQRELLDLLGETAAAWKVGTAPAPETVWGSPLPQGCVRHSPARLQRAPGSVFGLELEIAFRFARTFPAGQLPDKDEDILAALEAMALAVEVVSTRYLGWPEVPDLLKLADLQNHGALVLGEPMPYRADFPFLAPRGALRLDGADVSKQPMGNPAGDPRRLLAPFVRQCAARGLPVQREHWITTGSYSGIHFVDHPGSAVAELEGFPTLHLSFS
ncbi:MAG: 2-keto-4-pentenoate hydratase [Betaproteobacteria bacterium]|nr:2-keto-4-pentenoate hydratase [Betaproteobacteria bacterium]MDE2131135.1 2-keto-4-pentenoate hydratase [Betaproteobacteria bacterium]MDE2211755.1 2-keto-4-pentenoate hydratase [Betaproteobacteria bacterium]